MWNVSVLEVFRACFLVRDPMRWLWMMFFVIVVWLWALYSNSAKYRLENHNRNKVHSHNHTDLSQTYLYELRDTDTHTQLWLPIPFLFISFKAPLLSIRMVHIKVSNKNVILMRRLPYQIIHVEDTFDTIQSAYYLDDLVTLYCRRCWDSQIRLIGRQFYVGTEVVRLNSHDSCAPQLENMVFVSCLLNLCHKQQQKW